MNFIRSYHSSLLGPIFWRNLDFQFRSIVTPIQKLNWTYFFLCLGTAASGVAVDNASLRGRPRGRLSAGAGLPEGVAPELLGGGEGPLSEGSRLFSSDDILWEKRCTSNILENIYNCMLQRRLISQKSTFPGKLSISFSSIAPLKHNILQPVRF